ncbi:MAG: beta-N-acetylhexosaminidase [Zetaproteobacteria bacterium]|nr:beta-N-acetylhexosaminidase [Zetaproteobacteria bacterium]
MNPATWVIGLGGYTLTSKERHYLHHSPPQGVILFSRNCQNKVQITELLDDVRQQAGKTIWAAIDEEGGRVHRIPFAPFNQRPHAASYGALFEKHPEKATQTIYDDACHTGKYLADMGFTHNCAPVLDVFHAQGHGIIGQRALSHDKDTIVTLASACVRGFKKAHIEAVGKHFPGHGRANADSHLAVPTVDVDLETLLQEADIFRQVAKQGMQHIMSAHVIYKQVSNNIATFSPYWLHDVLREKFGFQGKIWSDDLCMRGAGENIIDALQHTQQSACNILLICEPKQVAQAYAALPN